MWQCVAVCGSVLQCVLQCVAVCGSVLHPRAHRHEEDSQEEDEAPARRLILSVGVLCFFWKRGREGGREEGRERQRGKDV